MNFKLVLVLFLMLGMMSCQKKSEDDVTDKIKRDSVAKSLEEQKQNLENKEKQLQMETENLKIQKARNDSILAVTDKINLSGFWSGSLDDGTPFDLTITDFDGKNFKGSDQIFADSTDRNKFAITGTFDPKTKEIIINEDKNKKGSGKHIAKLDANLTGIKGSWEQYSGTKKMKWELKRAAKEVK
jgi:hypothetical protein